MANETVGQMAPVSTAGGIQPTDLFYIFRPGSPALNFSGSGTDLITLLQNQAGGRIVTAAGAVTMVDNDGVVEIAKDTPENTAVQTPSDPSPYRVYTVKDGSGNAGTYNITISPSQGDIDGGDNFVLNSNWQSISFYFNGTNWRLVG